MGNQDEEIRPYDGTSRRCYLQELCNKYGDFKVAKAWKDEKTGEIIWAKHRSVLECWHSEEGLRYLDEVNNRTQLSCEVRIDLDPAKEDTQEIIDKKFNDICHALEDLGLGYAAFKSGGRSYHIHLIFKEMAGDEKKGKELVRGWLIRKLGGEMLKISENTMLTLEWAQNNKTGRIKEFVKGDPHVFL